VPFSCGSCSTVEAKRVPPTAPSLSIRKFTPWFAVTLAAAALAACAQSPVNIGNSGLSAARHRTALLTEGKRDHAINVSGHEPVGAAVGLASYYTDGSRAADGERLVPGELTAAHPTLPFGTRLRVTRIDTGRSVIVRVNDRGPFVKGRIVDVSHSAAEQLGLTRQGVAKVKIDVVQ
jgi:rare lipoprotein A